MKYQTIQFPDGWTFQILGENDEVEFQSPKRCPHEAAAARLLQRHLDKKRELPTDAAHSDDSSWRFYQTADGRLLLTRVMQHTDSKFGWAIYNPAVQANSGFEWQPVNPFPRPSKPSYESPKHFDSERDARTDLVHSISYGACDDHLAAAFREKRDKNPVRGEPGKPLKIEVQPVKVLAETRGVKADATKPQAIHG